MSVLNILRRELNYILGPKRWQVYAQSQSKHTCYVICEHRFYWAAEACSGWKPLRGDFFYDIQCRAGCKFCDTETRVSKES